MRKYSCSLILSFPFSLFLTSLFLCLSFSYGLFSLSLSLSLHPFESQMEKRGSSCSSLWDPRLHWARLWKRLARGLPCYCRQFIWQVQPEDNHFCWSLKDVSDLLVIHIHTKWLGDVGRRSRSYGFNAKCQMSKLWSIEENWEGGNIKSKGWRKQRIKVSCWMGASWCLGK